MGAAMLEAFLLLLCMLNEAPVSATKRYKDRAGKKPNNFDGTICCLGLEDFVEISAELNWNPASLISDEWKKALPESYREIATQRCPNTSEARLAAQADSLIVVNPAYSLTFILNMMRNRMHPGRWVREGHELQNEEAFSEWAQVAVVAAAHIRDCLLQQHQAALLECCKNLMLERLKTT